VKAKSFYTFTGVILLTIAALVALTFGFSKAYSASPMQCNVINRDFKCQVDIIDSSLPGPHFEPQEIIILKGAELRWNNIDPAGEIHRIASTDSDISAPAPTPNGKFDTGVINHQTLSAPIVLESAGRYNYYCQIHPWMRGQVTVLDQWVPEFPVSAALALSLATATLLITLRRMPSIRTSPAS